MDELIKLLDKNLLFDEYDIQGDEILIRVCSNRKETHCPYCGQASGQVHSRKTRILKDLPMQGRKVKILLNQRKFFCKNKECSKTTFTERFDFFAPKATKTNRLQKEILQVALTQSSLTASRYLRSSVADVGKSTICNMLKKGLEK